MSDSSRPAARTNWLALVALVLGFASLPALFAAPLPALAAAAVAVVSGIVAAVMIARARSGPGPRSRGLGAAIGGVVLAVLTLLLGGVPAVNGMLTGARLTITANNLKQTSLAMYGIRETRGVLPAAIVDGDGTPLLSWRVAILPFLEHSALYGEFHLDEPWDSPHNSKLISLMPEAFATPGADRARGLTGMVVPVAPGTAFADADERKDLGEGQTSALVGVAPSAIAKGLSNTAMIVSLPGVEVPWTKPAELEDDPVSALAAAKRLGHAAVAIAFADGSVGIFPTDADPAAIRALFTRGGGAGGPTGE